MISNSENPRHDEDSAPARAEHATVVETIHGWLSRSIASLAAAESNAIKLIASLYHAANDERCEESPEHWAFHTAARLESHVNEYWHLDNFIRTGILNTWRDDAVTYRPGTYGDLEALRDRTKIPLPSEMTPAWFLSVFRCLAGLTGEAVDFSWSARYTDRQYISIPAPEPSPIVLDLLGGNGSLEDQTASEELKTELRRYQQIPKWALALPTEAARAETNLMPSPASVDADTPLPTPPVLKPIVRLMHWSGTSVIDFSSVSAAESETTVNPTETPVSPTRSRRLSVVKYARIWREKVLAKRGSRVRSP